MKIRILQLIFLLLVAPSLLTADVVSKNNSANRLYKKGKYNESLSRYSAALLRVPEEPVLHYNLGNNQYKLQNYDKAIEEYDKALRIPDKKTRAKLNYNMGNTYVRSQKWEEALNSYIEALRLDPTDKDAKFNLELLRKMIKQNSQKQQQKGNSGKNQQEKKQPGQKGQDKKQGKNQQQNNAQEQQDKQDQQGQQEGKKKDISKEDAERILNALQEDEKNAQKDVKRMRLRGDRNVDKDW
jgi:Ca-activated chloride channel homolog